MNSILKAGYLLYRRKGIVGHAGVYLGNGRVFHNYPNVGCEVVSFADYSAGQKVDVVAVEVLNLAALVYTLEEILAADLAYNPLTLNCEHIANALLFGRRFSPQVQATIGSAILGGYLSAKLNKGNPFIVALLAGIGGCVLANVTRKTNGTVRLHTP